jgi:hypothetical protein
MVQYNNPWHAFTANFLDVGTKKILERKKEAKDYEKEQKELAEINRPKIKKYESLVTASTALANRLERDYGVTSNMISAAIAESPSGLTTMSKFLAGIETKTNKAWVKSNIEDLISGTLAVATDEIGTQQTVSEIIRSSYGLGDRTTGDYKADDSSWWQKGLGINAENRVKQSLDADDFDSGYSIYDLNQTIAGAGFESINPGSYVSYTSPNIFTLDMVDNERTAYANLNTQLRNQPIFKEAQTEHIELQKEIDGAEANIREAKKTIAQGLDTGGSQAIIQENQTVIDNLYIDQAKKKATMKSIFDDVVAPYIVRQDDTYAAGTYMDRMQDQIKLYFPDMDLNLLSDASSSDAVDTPDDLVDTSVAVVPTLDGATVATTEEMELFSQDGSPLTAITATDANGNTRIFNTKLEEWLSVADSATMINGSNTYKESLTGSDSTIKILESNEGEAIADTLTFEEYSNLSNSQKAKYSKDTDGNYSPLAVFAEKLGMREGTLITEQDRTSYKLRMNVDSDKFYRVRSGASKSGEGRMMSGSDIMKLDPSYFKGGNLTILAEALPGEYDEHRGYRLSQNRPWTSRDFNEYFAKAIKASQK